MIERYFFRGMRFSWAAPGEAAQATDGKVEAGGPVPPAPMTYQGVDMDLCTGHELSRRQNSITAGLRLGMQISFRWLVYKPGRTTTVPLGTTDVMTGFMSGCPIATLNTGIRVVAHVGTVANAPDVNRLVKQNFRAIMNNTARGFNPAAIWADRRLELMQQLKTANIPQVVALVTTAGAFFSMLVGKYPNTRDSYVIGGVLPIPAWNDVQLAAVLN
jgi:hypothetical protein